MKKDEGKSLTLNRRELLASMGIGAAGLGAASLGMLRVPEVHAFALRPSTFPGVQPPGADRLARFPDYNGPWTKLPNRPFGGFDFALLYMAEGVQGIDPLSDTFPNGKFSNTSGLFEQHTLQNPAAFGVTMPTAADTGTPLNPIPSGVGGNEIPDRSAEFWQRDILGLSNAAIRDDLWAAINWARRMWGLDFDDPAADGFFPFNAYTYQYPGSPDAGNEASLFSPRYAVQFDAGGNIVGYARMAPTLLAPDTAYTVVARAGRNHPNYTGGIVVNGTATRTTAASPDWPGKVRDGGFWGGVVQPMDVLPDIQAVSAGTRPFTTPSDPAQPLSGTTPPSPAKRGASGGSTTNTPSGGTAKWGQWWRRVAPIVGIDVDAVDATTRPDLNAVQDVANAGPVNGADATARPFARPEWAIGYFARGTDFFWGNYDLKFGQDEPTLVLHYQSEVPTRFRPPDGVPESFPCDLCPNPGSAEINARSDMATGTGIGLFDPDGEVSGFPDPSNAELNGQMSVGAPGFYGRVHGTSYPRCVRADGITTYSFRNFLLWPPRLNTLELGDPTQPNFGNINWTIPTQGFLGNPADPTGVNPPGNAPFN